jgi:hypothetical protein
MASIMPTKTIGRRIARPADLRVLRVLVHPIFLHSLEKNRHPRSCCAPQQACQVLIGLVIAPKGNILPGSFTYSFVKGDTEHFGSVDGCLNPARGTHDVNLPFGGVC